MARDQCIDCEGDFPFGKGLKDGRCPSCAAIFEKGRAEPEPELEPAVDTEEEE